MEVRKQGCECGATSRQDIKKKKTKSFSECKNPQKKSQFRLGTGKKKQVIKAVIICV
jgi:hypothetical protein